MKKNRNNKKGFRSLYTADDLKNLGKRIRDLRKSLDLSQEDFADSLDIGNTYLCGIESGKKNPKPCFFFKLARVYNISLDFIFLGTGPLERNNPSEKISPQREFVDNIRDWDDLLWLLENSTLFRDNLMGYAGKFLLDNEEIIKKNINLLRTKAKEDQNNGQGTIT